MLNYYKLLLLGSGMRMEMVEVLVFRVLCYIRSSKMLGVTHCWQSPLHSLSVNVPLNNPFTSFEANYGETYIWHGKDIKLFIAF